MLKKEMRSNSGQSLRGTCNGTPRFHSNRPSNGKPPAMQMQRNASGGKPVMPNFMTGQLRPQIAVRITNKTHC